MFSTPLPNLGILVLNKIGILEVTGSKRCSRYTIVLICWDKLLMFDRLKHMTKSTKILKINL